MSSSLRTIGRPALLRRAVVLEVITVGWNLLEGVVAIVAGAVAGSVALIGFGLDSFVESAAGGVLIWRFSKERHDTPEEEVERLEARATKMVAFTFFPLAAYVSIDAGFSLFRQERPDESPVGIALLVVSTLLMLWLARAKRATAAPLRSRALAADAQETIACAMLSVTVLVGIGLNALFGLWWADPVAAFGIAIFLVREGLEAWRGESHGHEH